MKLDQAVRRRRTIRRFDPARPLPADVLGRICDAGLRTPSAGYTQAVELLVLSSARDRDTYWALTAAPDRPADTWLRGMMTAPALVLIWTSEQAYRDRYAEPDKAGRAWSAPYWWVDAGMTVQNILLTATAAHLASAFVGVPPAAQSEVAAAFAVPGHLQSVGLVALGYPPAGYRPPAPRRPARSRTDRIHVGTWRETGGHAPVPEGISA